MCGFVQPRFTPPGPATRQLKTIAHPLNSRDRPPGYTKAPSLALRPQSPQSRSDQLAERKAAEQDVFLREVDDALRQDEMSGFFKRYGLPVGAAIVAALLGLAGFLWWQHSQRQDAGERGEQFTLALDRAEAGQLAEADKMLGTVAGDTGTGSAAAATLMRAGIAAQQGRTDEAAKLFAQVAADGDAPKPFRDLATIRDVALRFDAMPPQQVIDRLKPLAVAGNPWFGSAGELVGMAYMKQGRNDLAGPLFAAISKDKEAPEALRRRVRQLAGLLGVDAIEDPGKAVAEQLDQTAPQ